MEVRTESRYHEVYERSRRDPEGFWAEAASDIDWYEPAKKIFDPNVGVYGHWFVGATCNTCFNAVDRHVAGGRGAHPAIIYDSPVTSTKRTITYAELLAEVGALAAVLKDFGVGRGDRVVIYMPMVPEAVIAMLACARIGAIHSVVFGGFAANELATRIDDAKPKLLLSASCGIEVGRVVTYKNLLDEAIRLAQSKPQSCIILQRPQAQATLVAGRDHDWAEVRGKAIAAGKTAPCVPVAATDPDVAECAVIGVKDELKGEVPCGFLVLKAGVQRTPNEIEREIVAMVRERIGPVAAFKLAMTVNRLPKTRSGKILRGTMKKIADGDPWTLPATIDDPAILDEIGVALKEQGLAK
jgi:acyl-coenzyme A synthetase/AMP-(fatty) acid ligase